MLESIRASAQSFGVKVAFGLIILVFVFWGIGNFNDRDYSNVVAMVNGEPIVAQEFERAYMGAEEAIMRANPKITRDQLIREHLGRQVLRDMIQAVLERQEAEAAGMGATPLELRAAVGKMPEFHNDKGSFDPAAYTRYLENRRMSAADYEKRLGDGLTREKVAALVTAPVWIDQDEVRRRYDFMRESRDIEYVFEPAANFLKNAEIDEAAIAAWYEANKKEFERPAAVDVEYIAVRPEKLVDPASFPEAEALAWYEANKSQFARPERVKARHILIPVSEEAPEEEQKAAREKIDAAAAALASGKQFTEVADEFNVEGAAGPGGELGWIQRDQTIPAFEEALFALSPGKVTEPVRTQFGWHLILAEEKDQGGIPPFAEVEAEVRENLARDAGMDKLPEALDTLIEANILGQSLEESAAKVGLSAERTGLLDEAGLARKLGVTREGAAALLAAPPGTPLDTALEAGPDVYIVARIVEGRPASIPELAETREEVLDILKKEKAMELAMASAAKLLADYALNGALAPGLAPETVKGVEREGPVGDFIPDPEFNKALFEAAPGEWLAKPYLATTADGQGALIARVVNIAEPDAAEFESVAELLTRAARQERMEGLYSMFMQNLADKAEIAITNQALVDRTGR